MLVYFYYWGVSLTYPVLASFLSEEFLLCIPCWPHFCLGSISYTSRAGFTFIWVVSLTHAMLALLFCGEFLLHILWGVSLTHPMLASFILIYGVSRAHPVLASVLFGEVYRLSKIIVICAHDFDENMKCIILLISFC